ncbi:MAG: hypothetical protein M3261_04780, partial [Thermoproteota archaeon]|nr:hypothetical protein [Thermoproteota archaeon]
TLDVADAGCKNWGVRSIATKATVIKLRFGIQNWLISGSCPFLANINALTPDLVVPSESIRTAILA